jgi:hypothetical protein
MKLMSKTLVVAGVVLAAFAVAQRVEVRYRADLTGTGKGKVVWKAKDDGGEHQAEMEGEGERLPRNTDLWVKVGSNPTIQVRTNDFGTWRFSRRYTTLQRPSVSVGTYVTVRNAGGTVLQSGFMKVE